MIPAEDLDSTDDDPVDEASKMSFPASDAPAFPAPERHDPRRSPNDLPDEGEIDETDEESPDDDPDEPEQDEDPEHLSAAVS